MRLLRRSFQLTWPERHILIRGLMVVVVARLSLWLLRLEECRLLAGLAASGAGGESVEQVVWAVRAASRYVPGATCLTQALAAQALLAHSGFPSQVEIGVAKGEGELSRLWAHAWVVCYGQVVLGGQQGGRYNSLVVWNQQE